MPQIRSVAVSLLIATQALDAQVYLHPIISSGERSFRSIALAPPTADMIAQGFRRSDFKEKEAEQLAAALAGVVSSAMKKRGWAVDVNSLAAPALQDKDELRWLVGTLRARHQALAGEVPLIKSKDVRQGRCSLGAGVAPLSALVPADTLVFVHGVGHRLTKAGTIGQIAQFVIPVLSGVGAHNGPFFITGKDVHLRMSFVDSHSGDILCFLKVSSAEEGQILQELRKVP